MTDIRASSIRVLGPAADDAADDTGAELLGYPDHGQPRFGAGSRLPRPYRRLRAARAERRLPAHPPPAAPPQRPVRKPEQPPTRAHRLAPRRPRREDRHQKARRLLL